MSEPERSEYQPDEIESFLRILIRQSRTFITVLLVVSMVGLAWVWRSQPQYEVSFQYVAPDPTELVTADGVVIFEPFDLEVFEREIAAEGEKLALEFVADSAGELSLAWAKSAATTGSGRWVRYSMDVRENQVPIAMDMQARLVASIEKRMDERNTDIRSVFTKYIAYLTDEINRLMDVLKEGMSSEQGSPIATSIADQVRSLSEDLVSLRVRADATYGGQLLVPPSRSDFPVSISPVVKIVIVGFVAIIASVFSSLMTDYWQRARRPIS